MIANLTELTFAARSLMISENALHALREQLQRQNPDLISVTSRAYEERIASLQEEIAHYLGDHPAAVSRLLMAQDSEETEAPALVGSH